jgi:hypothetical protein
VGESSLYHKSMIRSNLVVESELLKFVGIGLTILEDIFGAKIKVTPIDESRFLSTRGLSSGPSVTVNCSTA